MQGKFNDAQNASERATSLAGQSADLSAHFQAALASAGTKVLRGNKTEATKSLAALRKKAMQSGYTGFELESRVRLAQLETESWPASGAHLKDLQSEAKQKGYLLLARQAASPLR
jgi:hypothetical protein